MPIERAFKTPNTIGFIEDGKVKAKKDMDMIIRGLGIEYEEVTVSGWPSVSGATLKRLAGNPDKGKFGKAKELFEKKGLDGEAACIAIDSSIKVLHPPSSPFLLSHLP